MKLFTNLPGSLRAFFGALRVVILIMAIFWFFVFTFQPWILRQFTNDPKLMVSLGEVTYQSKPASNLLVSKSAKPESIGLTHLRGTVQLDLLSGDPALVSALRKTVVPAIVVFLAYSWLLISSLRALCARIERGEMFSEENLSLVRRVGVTLLGYSAASFALTHGHPTR